MHHLKTLSTTSKRLTAVRAKARSFLSWEIAANFSSSSLTLATISWAFSACWRNSSSLAFISSSWRATFSRGLTWGVQLTNYSKSGLSISGKPWFVLIRPHLNLPWCTSSTIPSSEAAGIYAHCAGWQWDQFWKKKPVALSTYIADSELL